jgi:hypothetical protein
MRPSAIAGSSSTSSSSANGCMLISTLLNSCATVAARRPRLARRFAVWSCVCSLRRSVMSRVVAMMLVTGFP